jgi:hypothetical protein
VVTATVEHGDLEIRPRVAQRRPPRVHVGEGIVNEISSRFGIADEQCRPADLTAELAAVEGNEVTDDFRRLGRSRHHHHMLSTTGGAGFIHLRGSERDQEDPLNRHPVGRIVRPPPTAG